MKLQPSLRQKKRYVVFQVIGAQKFSWAEIKSEVEAAAQQFWGDWGKARASPLLLDEKFSFQKQTFIIKVNHKYVDQLIMAMALSKSIKNIPIIMRSTITSGTILKASSYL